MRGTVRFRYDAENDIHFAYPKWYVENEEDCKIWFEQFVAYFSRWGRKVDAIIVLDDFRIHPRIGSVWGTYRSEWITRYTRHSVRVRIEARVKTFNDTSAALHGGGFEAAPNEETAIELIRRWRTEAASG